MRNNRTFDNKCWLTLLGVDMRLKKFMVGLGQWALENLRPLFHLRLPHC